MGLTNNVEKKQRLEYPLYPLKYPLNIQRFKADSNSWSISANAYEVDLDPIANTSYVQVDLWLNVDSSATGDIYDDVYKTFPYFRVRVSNTYNSYDTGNTYFYYARQTSVNLYSAKLGPFNHNTDGTLGAYSITCDVFLRWFLYPGVGEQTKTAYIALPSTNFQRYFSQTPFIRQGTTAELLQDETNASFFWSTSEPCDWVRYHLDGSPGWVDVFNGIGNPLYSGAFTVSGLNPGSWHSVYVECRRADTGLWSNSNSVSFQTYYYPHVTGVEAKNLTIGTSQLIHLYNPLRRNVNLYMHKDTANGQTLWSGNTSESDV